MAPERACSATTADGAPCAAPSNLIDPETGLCPAHAPGASERLAEIGRKGAEAAARRFRGTGIDPEADLPPLDSPRACETWLEVVGRAVAAGKLSHNAGRTLAGIVREWLRANEAGEYHDRVEALEEKIAAIKRGELKVAR